MIKMRNPQWRVHLTIRFLPILLLCMLLSIGLSGCNEAELELVAEFFVVWAEENDILRDEELNLPALVNEVYVETVEDLMNSDSSAALDAVVGVPDNIEDADALAADGAEFANLELINKAIEGRPSDWSYYDQGGAVALRLGKREEEEAYRQSADNLVLISSQDRDHCNKLRLNQLQHRLAALDIELQKEFQSNTHFDLMDDTRNDTVKEISNLQGGSNSPLCQAIPE